MFEEFAVLMSPNSVFVAYVSDIYTSLKPGPVEDVNKVYLHKLLLNYVLKPLLK